MDSQLCDASPFLDRLLEMNERSKDRLSRDIRAIVLCISAHKEVTLLIILVLSFSLDAAGCWPGLDAAADPPRFVELPEAYDGIVAFAPDHQMIAIMEDDDSLRLVDFKRGATTGFLRGDAKISSVAFSADGLRVATGGWRDHSVRIWDVKSRRQLSLTDVPPRCGGIAFSPDGRTLVSSHYDAKLMGLILWDLGPDNSLKKNHVIDLKSVSDKPQPSGPLRFSPNGRWVAFGRDAIHVLDVAHRELKRFDRGNGPHSAIASYVFFDEKDWLVSADRSGKLTVWSVLTRTKVFDLSSSGPPIFASSVTSMTRVPNTDTVVTGSQWNSVTLWDLKAQKPSCTKFLNLPLNSNNALQSSDLMFCEDGEGLAVANEQKLYLFDLNDILRH